MAFAFKKLRIYGVKYVFLRMLVQLLSHIWLFQTLWAVSSQAPLPMGFSRQEKWSGLPFSPPGDLPNPGVKPVSSAFPALAGRFVTTEIPGKPIWELYKYLFTYSCDKYFKRKFEGTVRACNIDTWPILCSWKLMWKCCQFKKKYYGEGETNISAINLAYK